MEFYMKRFFPVFVLLALLCLAAPTHAEWNSGNDINTETDPLAAKILMDCVENMPWIPDGVDNGKYLYVFADAGCSATKQLYTLSRKYTKDVQIRWIFIDGSGQGTYNSLYEERTPEAVKEAFMEQTLPADKDPKKSAKIDLYAVKGTYMMLIRKLIAPATELFAYPTMVYGNGEKVIVNRGLDPSGLGDIIDSIPTVPVKKDFVPLALTADQDAVKLKPLPAGYKYVNNNSEGAVLYMMPDQNTPRVGSIPPKGEWPTSPLGVTESGYIVLEVTTNGGCVYCYDPVEVKRILEKK